MRFDSKQKDGLELSLCSEKLRALKQFHKVLNMVDVDSEILEWETSGIAEQENVVNNIEAISPFEAKKYVGMPIGKINSGMGRKEVGFKVLPNLNINQFIDLWNKFRTEKEWRFLRPAVM